MKIKSLILATVVSIIVFTSCDDFLKVNPDDALPPEEALSEQKDLDKALNGMYYTLTNTSFYGCNFLVRGEVGGDDIQPIGQTASLLLIIFQKQLNVIIRKVKHLLSVLFAISIYY